jgi:hypothetical protein
MDPSEEAGAADQIADAKPTGGDLDAQVDHHGEGPMATEPGGVAVDTAEGKTEHPAHPVKTDSSAPVLGGGPSAEVGAPAMVSVSRKCAPACDHHRAEVCKRMYLHVLQAGGGGELKEEEKGGRVIYGKDIDKESDGIKYKWNAIFHK